MLAEQASSSVHAMQKREEKNKLSGVLKQNLYINNIKRINNAKHFEINVIYETYKSWLCSVLSR